jgi:hypothetical protein
VRWRRCCGPVALRVESIRRLNITRVLSTARARPDSEAIVAARAGVDWWRSVESVPAVTGRVVPVVSCSDSRPHSRLAGGRLVSLFLSPVVDYHGLGLALPLLPSREVPAWLRIGTLCRSPIQRDTWRFCGRPRSSDDATRSVELMAIGCPTPA